MTGAIIAAPGLFYPFAVGLVAVVNPCGFPLLPAYLGLAIEEHSGERGLLCRRAERAIVAGVCATVGFLVIFGVIGLVVELGLSAFYTHAAAVARWVMAGIGIAMFTAGVAAMCHRPLRARMPELGPGLGLRRPLALFVFGISYGVASLGCAWPLFLSGVAAAFTRASVPEGLAAFAAYALGMGTFLAALALVVALFGPATASRLRPVSRVVPLLSSVVLVAVGAYLTLYWVMAIADPTGSSWPLRIVQTVQQWVSRAVLSHELVLGTVLGVLVAGTLIAVGISGATTRVKHAAAPDATSSTTTQGSNARSNATSTGAVS